MADTAGMALREPEQMDWDNFNPGGTSKYQEPPPAADADGKSIVYVAQLPKDLGTEARRGATQEGFRKYEAGPLTLPDGQQVDRFFTVSVKKFRDRKTGEPIEVSMAGKLIRAAGIATKPQTNADYDKAVAAAAGRKIQVTFDWEARNRDTGERVKGFNLFPVDPATGKRKAILKRGDKLTDGTEVQSEVLFANAVVRSIVAR